MEYQGLFLLSDATTLVSLPEPGNYRVWVRTRNWVATWTSQGTPGQFRILINGRQLRESDRPFFSETLARNLEGPPAELPT
jgi:hypothetical protein